MSTFGSSDQMILFASFFSIAFSKGLSTEEINDFSLMFSAISDLMAIIAAKQEPSGATTTGGGVNTGTASNATT